MLRERQSDVENIFGNGTGRSAKAVSADRYNANPKFAGQVEVDMGENGALEQGDEEQVYIEQLRRRLSRLSTQEAETETTARRKRLPSLALVQTVSRPLGQAAGDDAPPDSPRIAAAEADRRTKAVDEVCAAMRAFLQSPAGTQVRERAKALGNQPAASSGTGVESSTVTIAALAELRELAVTTLKQSVTQVALNSDNHPDDSRERSGLVCKIATRKRKRPATSSSVLRNSTCTVILDEMEEMKVVDAILGELLPTQSLASLYGHLRQAPTMSDTVWRRATKRYVETVTVPEGVNLSPVVEELSKMSLYLHAPGKVLKLLLGSVRELYVAAGKNVSADELLPLFIAAIARCDSSSNMAALQRFVEEIGHFSPCGEVARYLTDLSAAVVHILSRDGREVVREWLLAHEVEPEEAEFFIAEGYNGDACVRELELLTAEQLEALVSELTGALE